MAPRAAEEHVDARGDGRQPSPVGKPPRRLVAARKLCRRLPPIGGHKLGHVVYPPQRGIADDYRFVVRSQAGSRYSGTTADYSACEFAIYGYYKWRQLAIARALCAPGDTIIEIGANVGAETVGFAEVVGSTGRVYAFEPFPPNRRKLERALRLAGCDQVSVLPLVLGSRCETVRFANPPPSEYQGIGHVVGQREERTGSVTFHGHVVEAAIVEAECATLDSLADRVGAARVIFSDAEGSEVAILRGAAGYVAEHRPYLVLEASPDHLSRAGLDLGALHEEILKLGYRAFAIGRLGLAELAEPPRGADAGYWFCAEAADRRAVGAVRRQLKLCGLLPCIPGLSPLARRRP